MRIPLSDLLIGASSLELGYSAPLSLLTLRSTAVLTVKDAPRRATNRPPLTAVDQPILRSEKRRLLLGCLALPQGRNWV